MWHYSQLACEMKKKNVVRLLLLSRGTQFVIHTCNWRLGSLPYNALLSTDIFKALGDWCVSKTVICLHVICLWRDDSLYTSDWSENFSELIKFVLLYIIIPRLMTDSEFKNSKFIIKYHIIIKLEHLRVYFGTVNVS
jgi:hypothetical protein